MGSGPFQVFRRTWSSASVHHLTMWNASRQMVALAQRSLTTSPIHSAASALTRRISAQRRSPSASKKALRVFLSWPLAAHTSRPESWSTTTVK